MSTMSHRTSPAPEAHTVRGGMLGVDAAGVVVWATRGAHQLLGHDDGELVGRRWEDTFPAGLSLSLDEEGDVTVELERGPAGRRLRSFIERTDGGLVEHLSPAPTFDLFEEALGALELAERLQLLSTALSATVTLPEALDVFVEHALPALGGWRIVRSWTGYEVNTPDFYPLAGPMPGIDNLFVLGGVRGGYTIGPYISRLMGDYILGREPELPLFDPARNFSEEQS